MIERAQFRRSGFLVLGELEEPDEVEPGRRRAALGTIGDESLADEPTRPGEFACGTQQFLRPDGLTVERRAADDHALRVRLVDILTSGGDRERRARLIRELASLGHPLPAGVLRALASLARDLDARVRWAAATTLVHLLEALSPIARAELIGRLATSSRFELRLLIAQALRFGALGVGTLSALEHLVDDEDAEVRRAALVSARLRLAEAPARVGSLLKRKL